MLNSQLNWLVATPLFQQTVASAAPTARRHGWTINLLPRISRLNSSGVTLVRCSREKALP